jgi:hypothetical protein
MIPDSLETGIYLFRAYTGNYDGSPEMVTKLITVINPFGNNKTNEERKQHSDYKPLDLIHEIPANAGSSLKIYSAASECGTNKTIDLFLESKTDQHESGISLSVYKVPSDENSAGVIVDPESEVLNPGFGAVKIFNKLTLSGKVVDKLTKEPAINEVVLFSVPDSIPQINYARTDSNGVFLFEVDDYYGRQDVIVQTLSKQREMEIVLYPNLLEPPVKIPFYLTADVEKNEFVALALKRSMFGKAYNMGETKVTKRASYKYPFYGTTTNVVIPDHYIELDNFEEIVKELLPLIRLKKERNFASVKVYDPETFQLFENPWVIVDGVPLFDIRPVFPLNSPKVRKIETLTQGRCYGGLFIEGALSVFTKEGNYSTLSLPKNAVRKPFNTFQYRSEYPTQLEHKELRAPDFRDVLLWQPAIEPFSGTFRQTLQSSYEKGNYIAVAQTIDDEGNIQRSVFKFSVN